MHFWPTFCLPSNLASRAFLPVALAATCSPAWAEVAFVSRATGAVAEQRYDGEWHHYVGGGVAVMDCNGDHLPDLYAAGGASASRLFINTSTVGADVSFRPGEIADLSGVTGAYPLDVDGDGNLDLAILRLGANVLMRGLGDCRFDAAPRRLGL